MDAFNAISEAAVFYIVAAVIIISALGVVFSRNIIHSALLLVMSFLGIAACFFELQAGFLGLMQILIYGGAVSVLIVFAVMLVMQERTEKTNAAIASRSVSTVSALLCLALFVVLGCCVAPARLLTSSSIPVPDAVAALAGLMLGDYVLAFELAAILLLVAVAGAILLARGEDRPC